MTSDDSHERIVQDSQRQLARTRSHEPEFLGLPEPDVRQLAAELGLDLRVIGPGDAITLDLRPRRMTVVIAEGVAIEAFGG